MICKTLLYRKIFFNQNSFNNLALASYYKHLQLMEKVLIHRHPQFPMCDVGMVLLWCLDQGDAPVVFGCESCTGLLGGQSTDQLVPSRGVAAQPYIAMKVSRYTLAALGTKWTRVITTQCIHVSDWELRCRYTLVQIIQLLYIYIYV